MDTTKYFDTTIIATGTPSDYQRKIAEIEPDRVIGCSYKRAIEAHLICKPTLNLICTSIEAEGALINAVESVVKREATLCEEDNNLFRSVILVCATSIDQANQAATELYNRRAKDGWHVVVLHSKKEVIDAEGGVVKYLSFVDGKTMDAKDAFNRIEEIDDRKFFNEDNNPIIVFQVDMISEGVNVKSFNAVIISSNSDTKQMQQIGRVLRDYKSQVQGKGEAMLRKVDYGHASVYCYYENDSNIYNMVSTLAEKGLAWNWGDKLDLKKGTGVIPDPDSLPEENLIKWDPISELEIARLNDYKNTGIKKDIAKSADLGVLIMNNPKLLTAIKYILGKISNGKSKSLRSSLDKAKEVSKNNEGKKSKSSKSKKVLDVLSDKEKLSLINQIEGEVKDLIASGEVRELLCENYGTEEARAQVLVESAVRTLIPAECDEEVGELVEALGDGIYNILKRGEYTNTWDLK